jgi:hypothetical protein
MANDITGPVWRIDTLPFSYTGPVKLVNVSWTEAATAGDQLVMQSTASKPIIDDKAYAANYDKNFGFLGWYPTGIKVTTLTSGIILISVGSGKA